MCCFAVSLCGGLLGGESADCVCGHVKKTVIFCLRLLVVYGWKKYIKKSVGK